MTVTLEQFGGGAGVDNTAALNVYRAYINANGPTVLELLPVDYRFDSQPDPFDQVAPIIWGRRWFGTRLCKNFDGTYLEGMIRVIGVKGTDMRRLQLRSIYAGGQGSLLSIKSTAVEGASHVVLEDLAFDCDVIANDVPYPLILDGSAKVTGAVGLRTSTIRNVMLYTGINASALFKGTVGLSIFGGFVGKGLNIQNNAAINPAEFRADFSNIVGDVGLSYVWDVKISCGNIAGNILNDSNDLNCWISGRVTGTVSPNWINSGVVSH